MSKCGCCVRRGELRSPDNTIIRKKRANAVRPYGVTDYYVFLLQGKPDKGKLLRKTVLAERIDRREEPDCGKKN